jgi:hypothetical protein
MTLFHVLSISISVSHLQHKMLMFGQRSSQPAAPKRQLHVPSRRENHCGGIDLNEHR